MMDSATGCDVILVSYSTQRVVATGTDHREEGGGDWKRRRRASERGRGIGKMMGRHRICRF
jgi:hypothetical protein